MENCRKLSFYYHLSSPILFTDFQSKGPEALNFLQYICCNNIDQEQGTIIHTGMLNAQGGYENDCSIVPLRDRLVKLYMVSVIYCAFNIYLFCCSCLNECSQKNWDEDEEISEFC